MPAAASLHAAVPIPIPASSSSSSSSPRSRSRARTTPVRKSLAPVASLSQSPPLPPLPASPPPSTSHFPASTASTSSSSSPPPSYMASASSLADVNIRDFFPEGDKTLLKFMDEASIIRAQREALIALNDAALERALRESQETAAKEEESRKGKQKQKEGAEEGSTSGTIGASTVAREPEPSLTATSSSPAAMMPSSPPAERCSADEAAARLLAREWRVASLQRALLANPEMMPSVSSSSTPSSSSSSPSSSTSASASPSTSSTPRKSTTSASSRAAPMTIPAEAFYPRTHNHQHQHHRSHSSSISSPPKNPAPVQPGSVTLPPDHKMKSSPPPPAAAPRVYTSASSAAAAVAAQAAAKNNNNSDKPRAATAGPGAPHHQHHSKTSSFSALTSSHSVTGKTHGTTMTPAAEATPARKSASSPERVRPTTITTTTGMGTGTPTSSPAAVATPVPSRGTPSPKAHILTSASTSTSASASSSSTSSSSSSASSSASTSRSSTPNTSPGISPSPSVAPSSSQASPVMTSASKVAAAAEREKEKARMTTTTTTAKRSSTSASTSAAVAAATAAAAAANKRTTTPTPLSLNLNASPTRPPPVIVDRDRETTTSSIGPSSPITMTTTVQTPPILSALSSPLLKSTFAVMEVTGSSKTAANGTMTPPPPRDVDELFSLPAKKDVVPISSLSESDDEDDGDDEDEDESEDDEDEEDVDDDGESEVDEDDDDDDTPSETGTAIVNLEPVPFHDLYTANRSCSKCGESILSPRNTLPVPADPYLHISCPKCSTLHCRGCSAPALNCPKNCTGSSKSCMIKECCPQIRAIAIFEALSTFDHEFLLGLGLSGGSGRSQREEYIQAMITRPLTAQSKKLEMTLIKCMDALTEVFKVDSSSSTSSSSSSDLSTNITTLFESSFMPEVIHAFLHNTTVRDWITHCEAYCSILELLRYMTEGVGGGRVMAAGLRKIERSCGLKEWMWRCGEIVWAEEGVGSDDGHHHHSHSLAEQQEREKVMVMYRGQLRGGAEKVSSTTTTSGDSKVVEGKKSEREETREGTAVPLKSLMNELETHRGSLLEFLAKVSFMPTVTKLNALCDGISYLVLGQVLAGI